MTTHSQPDAIRDAKIRFDVEPESRIARQAFVGTGPGGTDQGVLSGTAHLSTVRKLSGFPMRRKLEQTGATVIALSALATWTRIDDALSPIIGRRGVAGLYKRSLSLTRAAHPVLAAVFEGTLQLGDYTTLQNALAQQAAPIAMAASEALLQTFHDLLTKLIGPSLTERLLCPLLDKPSSSGDAVKDSSR
jgi:hypothetical protein